MDAEDKKSVKGGGRPKALRIMLRLLLGLVLLIVFGYLGVAWYVHTHKKDVLEGLTAQLNDNIAGTLTIGGMEPAFLASFPNVALRLDDVVLRDSLYNRHKRTFLKAGSAEVAVNLAALLRGTIQIRKITVNDAAIDLFTDAGGYSNTAVFRRSKGGNGAGGGSFPELRKIALHNVAFKAQNLKMGKLYHFDVRDLFTNIRYQGDNWRARASLQAYAHSMAFNVDRGSFMKDKWLEGDFDVSYSKATGEVIFKKERLVIGGEDFLIGAHFKTGGKTTPFQISITNEKILWENAARLLSPNITGKLQMFNMSRPISVGCLLKGDFDEHGDPLIEVTARVAGNRLKTPEAVIDTCTFTGRFTNRYSKTLEKSDANSAIILSGFSGSFSGIPLHMKQMVIRDLERPVAQGDFQSAFKISRLSNLIDDSLLKFGVGDATVDVNYKADIVNYSLVRPFISGVVKIKNAQMFYTPRRLAFKKVNVGIYITKDQLATDTITMECGKSRVSMKGNIHNFLNLYYSSPERMVLNWEAVSPELYLEDFIGFAGNKEKKTTPRNAKANRGRISEGIDFFFEKCNVAANIRARKVVYRKFVAENASAGIYVSEDRISLKKARLNHAGGTLQLSANILPSASGNSFQMSAAVRRANVRRFLSDFNNFGMEALKAENLAGYLSSSVSITGRLTESGSLAQRSLSGRVKFNVDDGALVNFEPVRNVAKFAFPFRDSRKITFNTLEGDLSIQGERVTIAPMKINTSLLNMDVHGVYSFGRGTSIGIDVPLRNPAKDKDISDKEELERRRNRGIVLHLVAEDDEHGQVQIRLGKKNRE